MNGKDQFEHRRNLRLSASGYPVSRVDCCCLLKKWRVDELRIAGYELCNGLLARTHGKKSAFSPMMETRHPITLLIKSP